MKNYLVNLESEIQQRNGLSIPIYRIMPFNRILEVIRRKELVLSQTKLWDDVYENFLLKSKLFLNNNNRIRLSGYVETLYGQCWSLRRETDAMWRIYSVDKLGVKVKTTIDKLVNIVTNYFKTNKLDTFSIKIGKVKYEYLKDIYRRYSILNPSDFITNFESILIESQFIKRKEFNHEKEIRIIIRKTIPENKSAPNLIKLEIEPNEFINNIIFDPRLDYSDYEGYKNILRRSGFKNKIYKSKLYNFEPLILYKI